MSPAESRLPHPECLCGFATHISHLQSSGTGGRGGGAHPHTPLTNAPAGRSPRIIGRQVLRQSLRDCRARVVKTRDKKSGVRARPGMAGRVLAPHLGTRARTVGGGQSPPTPFIMPSSGGRFAPIPSHPPRGSPPTWRFASRRRAAAPPGNIIKTRPFTRPAAHVLTHERAHSLSAIQEQRCLRFAHPLGFVGGFARSDANRIKGDSKGGGLKVEGKALGERSGCRCPGRRATL